MTGSVCFDDARVRLLVGDARELLVGMPDRSVDCIVTSPPYYGLRDDGTGRRVGGSPGCRHSLGRGINLPGWIVDVDALVRQSALGGPSDRASM